MSNLKTAQMVQKIYERTKEGSLKWDETSENNAFQVSFPDASVKIRKEKEYAGYDEPQEYIVVEIYNHNGLLSEEITGYELGKEIDGLDMKSLELYKLARANALRLDETVNSILSFLGQNKTDET